jgi:hypothetical protein
MPSFPVLAAVVFLWEMSGPADPVTAGAQDRGVQASRTQNMAKLTRFDSGMDLHLLHPLIEHATQRLSQRTQTWRPISLAGTS